MHMLCVGTRGRDEEGKGPCACPRYSLDPHTAPPLVPANFPTIPQAGQAQGPYPTPLHPLSLRIFLKHNTIEPGRLIQSISKEKLGMLLAGDIGGTKTNLALFEHDTSWRDPVHEATFPSGGYVSLEALVESYLAQQQVSVDHSSFGVACPVMEGRATTTN